MRLIQIIFLMSLVLNGCAVMPTAAPRVTHVHTLFEVGLVGRDRYRLTGAGELRNALRNTGEGVIGREEFLRVCDSYFQHPSVSGHHLGYPEHRIRPVIVAYSYRAGPPGDDTYDPQHLAPILAVAREYGCDVCVVHPSEGGLQFQWAWRESLQGKKP